METQEIRKISFHFHPYQIENKLHAVEKAEGDGKRRKYLKGISSGIKLDQHGERMTEKCVKSFMDQANSGDVLLYPDLHGIRATEDIGKLIKAEITPDGDWLTEFRLYDTNDNIGATTLEKVDKLWKQINGIPPYKFPRQRGFSVEGHIPESGGILTMSSDNKRVIDQVELDGVVVVPRPAYKDSVANAVYKALGEKLPIQDSTSSLKDKLAFEKMRQDFFKSKILIFDNLDETIAEIMCDVEIQDKTARLTELFDEFKNLMVELILRSEGVFNEGDDEDAPTTNAMSIYRDASVAKSEIIGQIRRTMFRLEKSIERRT